MSKRLHDLAKELSVTSKAIMEKCKAEGIDTVTNHMSKISAGLEATIREWFSASNAHTAVETTEKVDLEKVRVETMGAPPKKARAARAGSSHLDDGGAATAVAEGEPAVQESASVPSAPATPGASGAPVAPARRAGSRPTREDTHAPGEAQTSDESPSHAGTESGEEARAAGSRAAAAAPARHDSRAPDSPSARAQAAPAAPPSHAAPSGPGASGPGGGRTSTVSPAGRPNVPDRPTVVKPVGKTLDVRTPAKLAGPKVVRIEAPEVVEAPRQRRAPQGDSPIPTSRGPRAGAGAGGGEEDASRSPRRAPATGRRREDAKPAVSNNKVTRRSALAEAEMASFSARDLAEREERLSRSEGFLRSRRRETKLREQGHRERAATPMQIGGGVKIVKPFTIKDLSSATGIKSADIVKKMFLRGVMANPNAGIDDEIAMEIMLDYNIDLQIVEEVSAEQEVEIASRTGRENTDIRSRAPVVTILGHVDHGKTSLLDRIRNTNIAAGEAGGITQCTRAFRATITVDGQERPICFLDTPGHKAFTEMRARGANLTDIAILVVAADDGVMPQTIESINHAKAAGVPIVVALNKIDVPNATQANIQKIMNQLSEHGLQPSEWGGTTEIVKTSATKGTGVSELLEVVEYQAQLLDLKADFAGPARGTVVEARREEGRGATVDLLIREGTLSVGDILVVGRAIGRVRDIVDDQGRKLKQAGPSMPVNVSGIDDLPSAGDTLFVVDNMRMAEEVRDQRRQRDRLKELAQPKVTMDSIFAQMKQGDLKELRLVVKADVQGSVDVLRRSLEELSTDEVKVRVLHAAAGGITESDVALAEASGAIVLGFNVIPSGAARGAAEEKKIEIRTYQVIYELLDDTKAAISGLLAPELRQEILGHAEVRQVFKVTKVGAIAGCYVTDGTIERNALVRVTRGGVVVENDRVLEQLKRFKDDAKEVRAGLECGVKIVGYDDIKEGDVIECYRRVEVKRTVS